MLLNEISINPLKRLLGVFPSSCFFIFSLFLNNGIFIQKEILICAEKKPK